MEEMVRIKYVDSDRLPGLPKPWWYRYERDAGPQMEATNEFLFGRGLIRRLRGGIKVLPAFVQEYWLALGGRE